MSVALTHIGATLDSPMYRELLAEPPIQYVNASHYRNTAMKLKNVGKGVDSFLMKAQGVIGFPSAMPVFIKSDLVHAAHHLVLNKRNWIVDFEHVGGLAGYASYHKWLPRKLVPYLLKRKECKRILAWTNAAKRSLQTYVGIDWRELHEKTEVLYPAVRANELVPQNTKKITLLFVSRYFEHKGGYETVAAMDKLTKMYDEVQAIVVSQTPDIVKQHCASNSNITFYGLMPLEELKKVWSQANIFVYGSWGDTLGYPILEAMSWGLPVVCLNDFASYELVDDTHSGFVVQGYKEKWFDKETCFYTANKNWKRRTKEEFIAVVDRLVGACGLLIDNMHLREQLGWSGYYEVREGRFSIAARNYRLKEIYEEYK